MVAFTLFTNVASKATFVRAAVTVTLAIHFLVSPTHFSRTHAQYYVQHVWTDASERQRTTLRKILARYSLVPAKLLVARFEGIPDFVPSVEIFQAQSSQACEPGRCLFVLTTDGLLREPFITDCRFSRANLNHAFLADGSKVYVFDFFCPSATLQIQVSREQFFITATEAPK